MRGSFQKKQIDMDDAEKLISDYSDEINGHCDWMERFGKQRLKKWKNFLKSNPEGAICEAATRKLLSQHGVEVEPYEDPSRGGPDFRCTKDNKCFYVEVTCISIEAATKDSGLEPSLTPFEVEDYEFMTEKIRSEVTSKIQQCSKVRAPRIVVVATLHSQAGYCCFDDLAAEEFLTATMYITGKINIRTGERVEDTYESTRLENSGFIRPKKNSPNQIEDTRRSVSAVLLCGFGLSSSNVIGCLNSNPIYSFDRSLLPEIKFCRLAEGYQAGQFFKVEWI